MSRITRFVAPLVLLSIVIQAILPFGYSHDAGIANAQSASGNAKGKSFTVSPGQAKKLTYDEATLEIGRGSVSVETIITIEPLAEEDLPALDQGMTNITRGLRRGYRLLPHNTKFNKPITIKLPYDPALIPEGLNANDLKTFFFNDQTGTWQELDIVKIDTKKQIIESRSDHFTDFINAAVTVPDHPQPLSYNPNSIKDIKAADPGNSVNLIEPPATDNNGDARLFYPIEVPAGRAGLQPQLGLTYNSNGGSGWLGLGWDLAVSAITIDTRWGVPRYHFDDDPNEPSYETETYLLDGQQLAPVAHRGPLQERTAEKQFHTRVESQFRQIIRHGDRPTNYWWEVVDKEGRHFFYGGDPGSGVTADSVLADPGPRPNVFRWMLREIRDDDDNTIRYYYDVVDGGAGSEPWRQIYLQRIRFTGTDGADGPYEVVFNREAGRPDVMVDGRPGFKTVLADVLTSIDVRLVTETPPLIRRYELEYETGQFSKSRLTDVIQYGEDGSTEFNRHTFEYFDEVTTDPTQPSTLALNGFSSTPDFGGATTVDGEGLLFDQESTAFGGISGSSDQVHFYGGVSPSGYSKELSAGAKVGLELSDSTTLLTLVDLNGDGLLDQVYESGGDIYFRANTGGPQAAPNFAPMVEIEGLSELGRESSTTFTLGGEIFAVGASLFVDKSFTRNRGNSYLSDVNGDGLPDLVVNGVVSFNTLVNGVPTFGPTSPTPLTPGAGSDTSGMVEDPEAGRADMEAQYHLVDPLRRWGAPYAGNVAISGQVSLLNTPPDSYTTADGVRLSIQHNGAEIWSLMLDDPTDTSPQAITGLDAVPVNVGDRLYFRVNSINDGAYDAVAFDPTITYTQLNDPPAGGLDTAQVDENNMPQFVYNAALDFAYGGRPLPFTSPFAGTATLAGTLEKSATTSDDVSLVVIQGGVEVHRQTLAWDQTGTFPVDVDLTLAASEQLQIRLDADTRVDISAVRFVPGSTCQVPGQGVSPVCVMYTTVDGQPAPVDQNGNPLLVFTPPVTAQIYPRNAFSTPYSPSIVILGEGGGLPGTCEDGVDNDNNGQTDLDDPTCSATMYVFWPVSEELFIDAPISGDTTLLNYDMTLSIKRPAGLLAKQRFNVRNGIFVDPTAQALDAQFTVTSGDKLYFVIDAAATDDSTLALNQLLLVQPQVSLNDPLSGEGAGGASTCTDGIDNDADNLTDLDDPDCQGNYGGATADVHLGIASLEAFGGGFRGWGFGQYNGQETTDPIDEGRLRLPLDEDDDAADYFVPMVPFLDADHWRAEDEESWISVGQMSASRLMVNYLDFPTGDTLGGTRGVVRYGGGESFVAGGGVGFSVLSFGAGTTEGTNWSDIDFLDFNGDRYPDVVGGGAVQTTLPNGALDDERILVGGFERVRESDSDSNNVNLGATMSRQISDARGRIKGITTEQAAYNLSASLGLTGNEGTYISKWDLIDMNGDGLPDYVRQPDPSSGETDLVVRLNLGYRFGVEEVWANASALHIGQSLGVGLSAGVGATLPAYSFGGGFSHSLSGAAEELDLVDVNGDGLVDLVIKDIEKITATPGFLQSSATGLSVRFNTGAGFTEEVYDYNGAMARPMRANGTVNRNLGLHFTIPIPIPFTPISIILNPGYNHGNSLGGFEVMLSDFDGDDYADHIYSDTNGNVSVNLNNHGRTNLLKTVHRPLGAVIELDYARSGNTIDQPGNRWVLSRVMVDDGFPNDGVDQVKTYQYSGGKYDRAEREFYGFRTVTEEHRDGNVLYRSTVQDFRNDSFYTKGLLERELTQDAAGAKYLETVNEYELETVVAGTTGLEDYTATRFPKLVKTEQHFYEGNANPGKSTFMTYAYDALGNMTQLFDAGDTGAEDDLLATVEYSQCQVEYIVGIPTKIVVTDDNGDEMRYREADIDCNTGDIEQIRHYMEDGTYTQTNLDYFENGNLMRVTSPENLNGDRYAIEYEYDSMVNIYPTTITDNSGYTSSASFNLKYGLAETNVDLNGNLMTYEYDIFGRLTGFTGPYDQGGGTPTIRFDYYPDADVPWARTMHLDAFRDPSGTDTIDTVVFIDGLKRVLQMKKDATLYLGPDTPADDNQMIVSGRVTFDFLGRMVEQYYPVTEPLGTAGDFNTTYDSIPPTVFEYDVLGRKTKTTIPDGTATSISYTFGTDRDGTTRFEMSITDANGIELKKYRDVRDQITSIKEFHTPSGGGSAQELWTSYAYDPMQQLVGIMDAESNVTTLAYDNLGRRTIVDNPDMGETEMVYDKASNMIAKITANLRDQGTAITYDYDAVNRLTTVTYPNFPANNVTYTYGPPGAGDNRAGRITLVQDQSGSEERFYGKLGEITREVKTVVGFTGAPPRTYTTEYVYDTFGRLQSITYPDGEVLTYLYDAGGMLRAATGQKGPNIYGYFNRLEYDKFEQRAFMEVGNGVRTQYTYDPENRRLANLNAGLTGASPFQNLIYEYDDVGNVLGLTNDVPVPAASEFGGPTVQTFDYDDLYRLIGASGTFQFAPDKSNQYSLSQDYDNIHNIVSKQQTNDIIQPSGTSVNQQKTTYSFSYAYDGPQPHAVTHLGNRSFTYDANGNQTGWTHDLNGTRREIVWDDENRIQSIFDNGHEKAYKYDDRGERVLKRGPQGQTAYVNQFFTIRNGQIGTKHIFAGETRLASKLMKKDPAVVEMDRYFLHPDHLGSSNYVTDADGQLYEHLEYFPFGETWVQEASNTQRTPYLFTAKELDEETGLYYYGARYYDPRTSQFLSSDPLLVENPEKMLQRTHLLGAYSYALNNPLVYTDPDGRDPQKKNLQIHIIFSRHSGVSEANQKGIQARVQSVFAKTGVGVDVHIKTGAVSKRTLSQFDPAKDVVVFIAARRDRSAVKAIGRSLGASEEDAKKVARDVAGSRNKGRTVSEGEEGEGKGVAFVGSGAAKRDAVDAANIAIHEIAAHILGIGHPTGSIRSDDLTRGDVSGMGTQGSLDWMSKEVRDAVTKRLSEE